MHGVLVEWYWLGITIGFGETYIPLLPLYPPQIPQFNSHIIKNTAFYIRKYNLLMLFGKLSIILWVLNETYKYTVGKVHSFLMLEEMVHIVTARLLTVSKVCDHVALVVVKRLHFVINVALWHAKIMVYVRQVTCCISVLQLGPTR